MFLDWGVLYIYWMQTLNFLSRRHYGRTPPAYWDVLLFPGFLSTRILQRMISHAGRYYLKCAHKKLGAIKCPPACHFFSSKNACLHVKYLSFADLFLAAIIRFVWCGIPLLDSTENRLACFCRFPFIFPKIK